MAKKKPALQRAIVFILELEHVEDQPEDVNFSLLVF
jgi:hypothetical protein